MITIKTTIYLEHPFQVGSFERTDKAGFAVARKIFGPEPSDVEVHEFILNNFLDLHFGEPQKFSLEIKRINPKRLQRQAKKEMEKLKKTQRPSTFAQDMMREDLEKNKKERKKVSKAQKEANEKIRFELKQEKKKQKKRGHQFCFL